MNYADARKKIKEHEEAAADLNRLISQTKPVLYTTGNVRVIGTADGEISVEKCMGGEWLLCDTSSVDVYEEAFSDELRDLILELIEKVTR